VPEEPEPREDPDRIVTTGEMVGEHAATRSVLWEAIRRLDDDQIEEIIELESMNVESLREKWGDSLADFRKGYVEGLHFLTLLLHHRFQPSERDDPSSGEMIQICMQCETFPIPIHDPCPVCRTSKWLHVARI